MGWPAATCIHNIQQLPHTWPGLKKEVGQLDYKEDSIAYLGIMVDIIQEWDRYTVFKDSIITGALPIQGRDVEVTVLKNS